ncbi:hypothetical protein ABZ372_27140 [Streptomyces sp. NPDC005921]|uniref:hypothetical protein n=1 Tax=Streptomyces sp. NPDC005827 TaxID=3157070 RepID=UPI0033FAAAB4
MPSSQLQAVLGPGDAEWSVPGLEVLAVWRPIQQGVFRPRVSAGGTWTGNTFDNCTYGDVLNHAD